MANSVSLINDDFLNQQMKQFEPLIHSVVAQTGSAIAREISNMYKFYIDDFYSYRTSSYVRHGEFRPGTGVGHTLYHGDQTRMEDKGHGRISVHLKVFDYEGTDWGHDYHPDTDLPYEFDGEQSVIDYIANGIRFHAEGVNRDGVPFTINQRWKISKPYHGLYWNDSSPTPLQAMQKIVKTFPRVAENIGTNLFNATING